MFKMKSGLSESLSPENGGILKRTVKKIAACERAIFIGLGGAGCKAVAEIKKRMVETYGKTDKSSVQFLMIDSNPCDLEALFGDNCYEYNEICVVDSSDVLNRLNSGDVVNGTIESVMPDYFNQLTAEVCNTRLGGILGIMDQNQYNKLYKSIRKCIEQIDSVASGISVHFVAGLGGKFGSGAVVHLPYIVRSIVNDFHLKAESFKYYGHLMLPGCYSVPGIDMTAIEANSYAALKEIVHYMNVGIMDKAFEAHYPSPTGCVKLCSNIFNRCYLVDIQENSTDNPMAAAVDSIADFAIRSVVPFENKTDDSKLELSMNMLYGNDVKAYDEAALRHLIDSSVAFPEYGQYSFGAYDTNRFYIPIHEINTILAARACREAEHILADNSLGITDADVDSFEEAVGTNPVSFINSCKAAVGRRLADCFDRRIHKWTPQVINNGLADYLLEECVRTSLIENEKNDFVANVLSNIENVAINVFKSPEMGPYHLEKILLSVSGMGGVRGYYERLDNYVGMIIGIRDYCDVKTAERLLNAASTRLLKNAFCGKINTKSREFLDFKEKYIELYTMKYVISLCDMLLNSVYFSKEDDGLKTRIRASFDKYLEKLSVLKTVIFAAEKDAEVAGKTIDNMLSSPTSLFNSNDTFFTTFGHILSYARYGHCAEFEAYFKPANFVSELTGALLDGDIGSAIGPSSDNAETAEFVREFFADSISLSDCYYRSALEVFDNVCKVIDQDDKFSVMYRMLEHLINNSSPNYNMLNNAKSNIGMLDSVGFRLLFVPSFLAEDDTERVDSWAKATYDALSLLHRQGYRFDTYVDSQDDSIIYSSVYVNLPFFINRSAIKYERSYEIKKEIAGLHLDDNTASCTFREYPALVPVSQYYRFDNVAPGQFSETEREKMEEAYSSFDSGVLFGIVVEGNRDEYECTFLYPKSKCYAPNRLRDLAIEYLSNNVFEDNIDYNAVLLATCDYVRQQIGTVTMQINPIRLCRPVGRENTSILIRMQMDVFNALKREVDLLDAYVASAVEEYTVSFKRI